MKTTTTSGVDSRACGPPPAPWKGFAIPLAVATAFLLICRVTFPMNHSEAEDAYAYAWAVEQGDAAGLVHPHHIAYGPVGHGLYRLFRAAGFDVRPFSVLSGLSLLCGTLTVLLLVRLYAVRLGFGWPTACLGALLPAFSYGFWRYSMEAEICIPACLFIAALLYVATRPSPGILTALAAGVVAGVGILVHIMSVAPAIAAVLFFRAAGRARYAAAYALAVLGVAGLGYGVAAFSVGEQPCATVCPSAAFSGRNVRPDPKAAISGAVGLGSAIVSGNFVFANDALRPAVVRLFPARMLEDDIFTGRHADAVTKRVAPVTAAGVLLAALLAAGWALLGLRRRRCAVPAADGARRPGAAMRSRVMQVSALAFGIHALAVLVWEPANPELWIQALIPLWVLVAALADGLGRGSKPQLAVMALLVLMLGLHNYVGGLRMTASADGDYNLHKASWLVTHTGPGDAIITAGDPVFVRYLRYFAPARVLPLESRTEQAMLATCDEAIASSERVYATGDIFRPPPYLAVADPERNRAIEGFARKVAARFYKVIDDEFGGVYAANPPFREAGRRADDG